MKAISLFSHAAVAAIAAAAAAMGTYLLVSGEATLLSSAAQAQAGQRTTDVLKQMMSDLNREMQVRVTERDPGNGSAAHRHPGHHTFGYVLEGTYEVRVDNGPVRQLKAGEVFYEPPGSLHAVSRNPSATQKVRYLIFQVNDPTKPGTVPE
jgi:quercetin dioxygenase-like cupin family protein